MRTKVTKLDDARVRIDAEIPAAEITERFAELHIPGFRKGKTPIPVIANRLGIDAIASPYYVQALDDADIAPVGNPTYSLEGDPKQGKLTIAIEVDVLPDATLGQHKGVAVTKPSPEVPEEAVEAELAQLRTRLSPIVPVDRPAETGDFVVIDFEAAFDGGIPRSGAEHRVQLGSGALVLDLEQRLEGARAGEHREETLTFPDDYGHPTLAGAGAKFAIDVRRVEERQQLSDDELAAAAEHPDIDHLRAHIREMLAGRAAAHAAETFRAAALDAVVANADVSLPDHVVEAHAQEVWGNTVTTLAQQGIDRDTYLEVAKTTADEIIAANRERAAQGLGSEAVLAAVAVAEGITPTEQEIHDAARARGLEVGEEETLAEAMRREGMSAAILKASIVREKALDLIVEHATPLREKQERQ